MGNYRQTSTVREMLGRKCHYCPAEATTRDHIVPKARGGRNGVYNLVPSCAPCNLEKGDAMPTCECRHCRAAVRQWEQVKGVDVVSRLLDEWNAGRPKGIDQGDAAWNGGAR